MERRRATIYLDADLHRALKLKAADSDRTVSDIEAEAVRRRVLDLARARLDYDMLRIVFRDGAFDFVAESSEPRA